MSDRPNALFPPPSLEDELRRLIATHGGEAVKTTAAKLTKRPRGRTPTKDWQPLAKYLKQDAAAWLSERKGATNYAIAKAFAAENPGWAGAPATHRRIMDKLAEGRELWMLTYAHWLTTMDPQSRAEAGQEPYPFAAYFRTMEKLAKVAPDRGWGEGLRQDQLTLARYREIYGEPDASMTWYEVREKARDQVANALLALTGKASSGGMFGAVRRSGK